MNSIKLDEILHSHREDKCNFYIPGSSFTYPWRYILHFPLSQTADITTGKNVLLLPSIKALIEWAPSKLWPDIPLLIPKKQKTQNEDLSAKGRLEGDLFGYMNQRKPKGKGTQKRFFILRKANASIYMYKSDSAKTPQEVYTISDRVGCSIVEGSWICIKLEQREIYITPAGKNENVTSVVKLWENVILDLVSDITTTKQMKSHSTEGSSGLTACRTTLSKKVFNVASGDNETKVKKEAEKVAASLATEYPEFRFGVMYESLQDSNQGSNIGYIYVFRGVHYSHGSFLIDMTHGNDALTYFHGQTSQQTEDVSRKHGNKFIHNDFNSKRNMYGFVKSLSFNHKLSLLKACRDDGTCDMNQNSGHSESGDSNEFSKAAVHVSIVVDSILSDIADELSIFSYSSKGIDFSKGILPNKKKEIREQWAARMLRLKALSAGSDIFGSVKMDSSKYTEIFRLCVILELQLLNIRPPGDLIKYGRPAMIGVILEAVIQKVKMNLAEAVGLQDEYKLLFEGRDSIATQKTLYLTNGVSLSCINGFLDAKYILLYCRQLQGFAVPFLTSPHPESQFQSPYILSKAQFEDARSYQISQASTKLNTEVINAYSPNPQNIEAFQM